MQPIASERILNSTRRPKSNLKHYRTNQFDLTSFEFVITSW